MAMDTEFAIILLNPEKDVGPAFSAAQNEVAKWEKLLSDYDSGSTLNTLRGHRGDTLNLPPEIAFIFQSANAVTHASQGALDFGLHRLKRIWGLGTGEKPRIPSDLEIQNVMTSTHVQGFESPMSSHDSIQDNKLSHSHGTWLPGYQVLPSGKIILLSDSIAFDLGAIAKGWVVDRLSSLLDSLGFPLHHIQAGGDMRFSGVKSEGPWRVGLRHPRRPDTVCGVLNLPKGLSVSTSGDYERFFLSEGKRYHHIMNPQTGKPAEPWCATTVLADSSILSDGLSTSLFILGPDRGAVIARQFGAKALWIRATENGLCYVAMPEMLPYLEKINVTACP